MAKTEKGPISSFIIGRLSELHTIHQYIPGKLYSIPDSCSRFPMLGPNKQLETRGYANSVEMVLKRLPVALKAARVVHFHGGKQGPELRATLKLWFHDVGSLTPLNPSRTGIPSLADLAILTPRSEIAPVSSCWPFISWGTSRLLSCCLSTCWIWLGALASSRMRPISRLQNGSR
jgi:hypothetical protein